MYIQKHFLHDSFPTLSTLYRQGARHCTGLNCQTSQTNDKLKKFELNFSSAICGKASTHFVLYFYDQCDHFKSFSDRNAY